MESIAAVFICDLWDTVVAKLCATLPKAQIIQLLNVFGSTIYTLHYTAELNILHINCWTYNCETACNNCELSGRGEQYNWTITFDICSLFIFSTQATNVLHKLQYDLHLHFRKTPFNRMPRPFRFTVFNKTL